MPVIDDPRASWGAARNTNPKPVGASYRVGISWHYDGGAPLRLDTKPHSACLVRVREAQAFHMGPSRGWADIGYNLLICPHGRAIEGRGLDMIGAHSPGVNVTHYGVQFMLGVGEPMSEPMKARGAQLAADLAARSGHSLRQWGHKDDPAVSTECPGALVLAWVRSGGPSAPPPRPPKTPTPPTPPKETDPMPSPADLWNYPISLPDNPKRTFTAADVLRYANAKAGEAQKEAKAARAEVAGIKGQLDAIQAALDALKPKA